MYKAIEIARFFIVRGAEEGVGITPMKLQKLVYFAHGWHLALKKKPLLDEDVQAWKYGPVIPSLYEDFKHLGNNPISIADFQAVSSKMNLKPLDDETRKFLDFIWGIYKEYSAIELSNLTHVKTSPWEAVVSKNEGRIIRNLKIDNQLIGDYFIREYLAEENANG